MGALEERVAYLEGRGEEHAAAIGEVRADVGDLRADVRDLRADMNRRLDHIEQRFDHTNTKFMWLIGFQFTTLIAAIAALLNGYFR
jgi:hypothetical protein